MLLRPQHIHNVNSPEEYRSMQAAIIAQNRARVPKRPWSDPWICLASRPVYIALGKWLLRCVCGNAPSVDPEWQLACCLECGAIFEHVTMPDGYLDLEFALLQRPNAWNQAWVPDESVDDLHRENVTRGVLLSDESLAVVNQIVGKAGADPARLARAIDLRDQARRQAQRMTGVLE